MSEEFKREERYIVVKLKHLAGLQIAPLRNFLRENRVPTIDCVVVEADWPEYEPVWQMIEDRMTGKPSIMEREAALREDLEKQIARANDFASKLAGAEAALSTTAKPEADHE